MTLPSSGPMSLSMIQTEFGGSNPVGLSEYYRGGAYVPNNNLNTTIPTSGVISLSDFYGTSSATTTIFTMTAGTHAGDFYGYNSGAGAGSISPTTYGGYTITVLEEKFSAVDDFNTFTFTLDPVPNVPPSNIFTTLSFNGIGATHYSFSSSSASYSDGIWSWTGPNNQTFDVGDVYDITVS